MTPEIIDTNCTQHDFQNKGYMINDPIIPRVINTNDPHELNRSFREPVGIQDLH